MIDVPRAATLLAQGTGRLIRSRLDRGVVAVFDTRLGRARYRWALVNALPPMRRTRHRADVEAFLAPLRAGVHRASTLRAGASLGVLIRDLGTERAPQAHEPTTEKPFWRREDARRAWAAQVAATAGTSGDVTGHRAEPRQ